MRKRRTVKSRVYVKRRGPSPAAWLAVSVALALIAFVFFAKPAIGRLSMNMDEAPVTAERVTRDVSFDALSLYMVELARVGDAAGARIEAARYVPRGAAGYLYQTEDTFAVIGTGFSTRADAESVALALQSEEGIGARVHALTSEEARLRVTATEAQISALIEGEGTLRALTSTLWAHALSLDRSESEPSSIAAMLMIESEQALSALARLKKAAGDAPNQVAGALIDRLTALADHLSRLTSGAEGTALTLSSRLKYAFLNLRISHIEFLKELG